MGDTTKQVKKVKKTKKEIKSADVRRIVSKVQRLESKIKKLEKLEEIDKKFDKKLMSFVKKQREDLLKTSSKKDFESFKKEMNTKLDRLYLVFASKRELKNNIVKINLKLNKIFTDIKDIRKDISDNESHIRIAEQTLSTIQKTHNDLLERLNILSKRISERASVEEIKRLFVEFDNLEDLTHSLEKQFSHILSRLRKLEKLFDQAQVQEEEIVSILDEIEKVGGINGKK